MNTEYTAWVVVEGKEFEIMLTSPYTEEEARSAAEAFKIVEKAWFGLKDGSIICINQESTNFYFLIKPVVQNG